jgi:hypothetical protein
MDTSDFTTVLWELLRSRVATSASHARKMQTIAAALV